LSAGVGRTSELEPAFAVGVDAPPAPAEPAFADPPLDAAGWLGLLLITGAGDSLLSEHAMAANARTTPAAKRGECIVKLMFVMLGYHAGGRAQQGNARVMHSDGGYGYEELDVVELVAR
jgi:hypothetical protein